MFSTVDNADLRSSFPTYGMYNYRIAYDNVTGDFVKNVENVISSIGRERIYDRFLSVFSFVYDRKEIFRRAHTHALTLTSDKFNR